MPLLPGRGRVELISSLVVEATSLGHCGAELGLGRLKNDTRVTPRRLPAKRALGTPCDLLHPLPLELAWRQYAPLAVEAAKQLCEDVGALLRRQPQRFFE